MKKTKNNITLFLFFLFLFLFYFLFIFCSRDKKFECFNLPIFSIRPLLSKRKFASTQRRQKNLFRQEILTPLPEKKIVGPFLQSYDIF